MCDRKDNYRHKEDHYRYGPPRHRLMGRGGIGNSLPWALKVFAVVVMIPGFLFLGSWISMLIWNAILPVTFGLPILNFWQTMGILALGRLIFGGHRGGPGRGGFLRRPPFKDGDAWKSHLRERFAEDRKKAEAVSETDNQ